MYHRIVIGAALSLMVNGCFQGYKRADELEDEERGPSACAQSCQELGMHMSAFVLVDRQTSGCVCSPNPVAQAPRAELEASGPAAAYAMLEAQRQARQQQQQQQASHPKP